MMSLSDKKKQNTTAPDEWKPLDLNSIQHINDERFLKKEKNKPDYNLFKLIYEDPLTSEQDAFKTLYKVDVKSTDSQSDESHDFKGLFQEYDEKVNPVNEGDFQHTEDFGMENKAKFHEGSDRRDDIKGIVDSGFGDGYFKDASGVFKPDSVVKTGTDNVPGQDSGRNQERDSHSDSGMGEESHGYEKGFNQGFDKGKEDGLIEGRAKGKEQGYAEGFAKGENEAKKTCDAKAGEILSLLKDIFLKTNDAWEKLVKKYENQIISLVCRIAEKVVLAKVAIDDKIVRQSIFQAMEKMPEPEEINLHISPDDYEYIEMIKEDFFDKVKGLTSVSLVSDPSVARGGCRIESSKAKIETSIESRLDEVFSSIVKAGDL